MKAVNKTKKGLVNEIRDQGTGCKGSCWAFSTISQIESVVKKARRSCSPYFEEINQIFPVEGEEAFSE